MTMATFCIEVFKKLVRAHCQIKTSQIEYSLITLVHGSAEH